MILKIARTIFTVVSFKYHLTCWGITNTSAVRYALTPLSILFIW